MAFTVLYAAFALLALIVIFGLTYKIKGIRTAFMITGIALIIFAILLVATIYAIIGMMPN